MTAPFFRRRAAAALGLLLLASAVLAVDPRIPPTPKPASGAAPSSGAMNFCSLFYPPTWKPLVGTIVSPEPDTPRPAKGIPFRDPVHGTCVVRVTEHDKEPPKGFARSDYARRQAFNADDTRLLVVAEDGAWHLYDPDSYSHLDALKEIGGDAEPQWHPTDPDLLYFLPRNGVGMKLYELNVRTGQQRTVADFGDRIKARWPKAMALWTKSEGSPSADGRYWCFMVDDADWHGAGIVTWDLQNDRILAMMDLNGDRPDHVSMSPSGNYCVVSGTSKGTVAYTRDLTQPRVLRKGGEHSDLALDAKGDDVYVSVDYEASGGPVYTINLRTGARTDLFPSYAAGTATAMHFSGKAFRMPGWAVVSTYADYASKGGKPPLQWLHRKVFAVSLDPPLRIVELAHHHSNYDKYWTEPQATVNRDFTRIVFNSNWGTKSETDVETFMVMLPPKILASVR